MGMGMRICQAKQRDMIEEGLKTFCGELRG